MLIRKISNIKSYLKKEIQNQIIKLIGNTIFRLRLISFSFFDSIGISFKKFKSSRNLLDNLKVSYINPQKINYYIEIDNKIQFGYYIEDRNWDFKKKKLTDTFCIQFIEVKELLQDRKDIENTTRFKNFLRDAKVKKWSGDELKNTLDWYTDYCEGLRRVYNSIKKIGYKSQEEIEKDVIDRKQQEINVSIDRYGNYLFEFPRGGTHRLAIAKLLKLSSVPVIIRRVHYLYFRSNKIKWKYP